MWFLNLCYLLQIWNKVLSSGVETIGTTLGSITWLVCILQNVFKIETFWSIKFSPVMWPIQNALREKCINTDQKKLHIWILFRHWWLQWITFLMRRFLSRHGRLENLKIVIFYQDVCTTGDNFNSMRFEIWTWKIKFESRSENWLLSGWPSSQKSADISDDASKEWPIVS